MAETKGRARPARAADEPAEGEVEAVAEAPVKKKPGPKPGTPRPPRAAGAKKPGPKPKAAPTAKKAAPAAKKASTDVAYTVYAEDAETGALVPVGDIVSEKVIDRVTERMPA